jgi:hypothetical protein
MIDREKQPISTLSMGSNGVRSTPQIILESINLGVGKLSRWQLVLPRVETIPDILPCLLDKCALLDLFLTATASVHSIDSLCTFKSFANV